MNRILIAHRGNIAGSQPEYENTIPYLFNALNRGFHCEFDLWFANDKWWLGHDAPTNETSLDPLRDQRFWIHAKTLETVEELYRLNFNFKFFYHTIEDAVFVHGTNNLWTYPGRQLLRSSIAVKPEIVIDPWDTSQCAGICSDYIGKYSA